jgi:formiminotetrahydrofolate cyclodeaminase
VQTFDGYLERLASAEPVPGGGSAAAAIGALAAALVAMVGRITAKNFDDLVLRADELRTQFAEAQRRDEEAYAAVVAAQALPKNDERQRAARAGALELALEAAAAAPLHTASLALGVLELVNALLKVPMGALSSDIACAAEFAFSALTACGYNARVNHRDMHDKPVILRQTAELVRYEGKAARILGRARKAIAKS